ncbi:hypothetical protein PsYK624_125700 [Phanerochaete sordida]|uniref:Uncharacterized protein n=1 Tax=Phanerochaete sordida TaxID=48140 RepID=A0A9P3GMW0_9APHY|nr:hypothetical protein PsYK624_125700 [Phanerochaete sordida]
MAIARRRCRTGYVRDGARSSRARAPGPKITACSCRLSFSMLEATLDLQRASRAQAALFMFAAQNPLGAECMGEVMSSRIPTFGNSLVTWTSHGQV